MSHLTHEMVEQFFAREEENARGVLRKEMDSAMDTIFKQMKRKLMMLVESGPGANETGHGLTDLGDPTDREQQISNDTNHILSTSANSQAQFGDVNASNRSQQGGSGDGVPHEQQLSSKTNQIPSTSTDSFVPDNANSNQNDEIVNNKLGELVNIISMPTSSTQSQPSNDNDKDDNLFDELDDDEEDCDCSECMEGCSVNEEDDDAQEGDDDDEISQSKDLIDESNDASSRPTKRPRLENVQVQHQAQPNTKYITISLKCSECSEMFQNKDVLNAHFKSVHSIKKYRCLYKECNRSFDNKTAHSKKPHTMWPCGLCSGHYKSSDALHKHHLMYHEEGLFQCARPDCQFVAELKQTVLNHFRANHKIFVCQHPGCMKQYSSAAKLKIHERTHLNARPYRCKWPKCKYGSAHKHHVIRHIHTHLVKITKKKKGISHDPNHYLEVVSELL